MIGDVLAAAKMGTVTGLAVVIGEVALAKGTTVPIEAAIGIAATMTVWSWWVSRKYTSLMDEFRDMKKQLSQLDRRMDKLHCVREAERNAKCPRDPETDL